MRTLGTLWTAILLCTTASLAASSTPTDPPIGDAPSLELRMLEVETQVPGFGGLFYDEDGVLTVYLSDRSTALNVGDAILSSFGPDFEGTDDIRIRRGTRSFSDLLDLQQRSSDVMDIPGVAIQDADESQNVVVIGIDREIARSSVEEELTKLGLPADAFRIELVDPFELGASLRDRVRPVRAGLQVGFGCTGSSCNVCTLGFNAARSTANGLVAGFVTASHCSRTQGGAEGTVYFQSLSSLSVNNRIGRESVDPAYFTGGQCPYGRRCRYSDAAFVAYDPDVQRTRGVIARPTGLGSITISTTRPRFRIVSESLSPVVGEIVNKVGRTTGWTQGRVTRTGVNTNVSGTNITLIGQAIAGAGFNQGDSGSGVFRITNSPYRDDVQLKGIAWGFNSAGEFVFSPFGNLQRELAGSGGLVTCPIGLGC